MKDITYFLRSIWQTDEENDQWKLRSSHITEELAEQWIINLIEENSDYEDINFRIDECHDDRIQLI